MLKGVDGSFDWCFFREWLTEGELPRVGDSVRTKDALLSRTLADRLRLGVGDRVEMLFVEPGELPRRDRFKVSGIYASGLEDMDGAVVLTDLRNVQRLAEWTPEKVSGYEILLDDLAGADAFAARLSDALLYDESDDTRNLVATSVMERYPNIFDWLRAHDVNGVVIVVIMLVVAFFNMASALMILVLERTRMIGLLKAFGMPDGQLRRIFLWRAAFITRAGVGKRCGRRAVPVAAGDASGEARRRGIPAFRGARGAGVGLVAAAQRGIRRGDRRAARRAGLRGLHRQARRDDKIRMRKR